MRTFRVLEESFFSACRRSWRVTLSNTGQKGKSLALDSSCVHLGPRQTLERTDSLQGPKAFKHSQMSNTEEGGGENRSQKQRGEDKTCFTIVVNLGGVCRKVHISTLRPRKFPMGHPEEKCPTMPALFCRPSETCIFFCSFSKSDFHPEDLRLCSKGPNMQLSLREDHLASSIVEAREEQIVHDENNVIFRHFLQPQQCANLDFSK